MTKTTVSTTTIEPTLAQLRADAVIMLGISKTQSKKLSREVLITRLEAAAQASIAADAVEALPADSVDETGDDESTDEAEDASDEAGTDAEASDEAPVKVSRPTPKRPIRFTYVLNDGTAARANFATVENAQAWGTKAVESGTVREFAVL